MKLPTKDRSAWVPRSRLNKRLARLAVAAGLCITAMALVLRRNHDGSLSRLFPFLGFQPQPPGYKHCSFSTTSYFSPVSIDNPASKSTTELYASFPRHLLNKIQPVLKMGHGENKAKIEAQLDSVSACFHSDDLLIYSDMEETIRGRPVVDILADLPAAYYDNNPDIRHYLWQNEMRLNSTLDKDLEATNRIDGWTLDKDKFVPMIERAWTTKPNKDFYFFFETDTYVFWDNAFRFLQTFDPVKLLYMGSPSPGRTPEGKDAKT